MVDGFLEHRLAIALEIAEHFGVGTQSPGTDAEHEAAIEQVIEHRHIGRDLRRMPVGQVHGAAAAHDARGVLCEAREEDQAIGDGLGAIGDVLTDEGLGIAQRFGEQDRGAILGQVWRQSRPGGCRAS